MAQRSKAVRRRLEVTEQVFSRNMYTNSVTLTIPKSEQCCGKASSWTFRDSAPRLYVPGYPLATCVTCALPIGVYYLLTH